MTKDSAFLICRFIVDSNLFRIKFETDLTLLFHFDMS